MAIGGTGVYGISRKKAGIRHTKLSVVVGVDGDVAIAFCCC